MDLVKDLHHHHAMLRTVVHKHVLPQYTALHRIIPKHVAPTPEMCGECHQKGTKYIMEHSMDMLKKICQMAAQKECHMAKICGLMAKKPEVTMGMMIEHVRPLSLTTAYCVGKGTCDIDNSTLAEIEMGMQPHEALFNNFDEIDW